MIRIPTLDSPQVSSTGMPTPFENTTPPGAGGLVGAVAGVAGQAAEGAAKVISKVKSEADAQAIQEAHNSLRAWMDAGLQRVKDAQGKNAAIEAKKFYDDADKISKKVWGGLANNEQQLAFTKIADDELLQTKKIAESHVGEQIRQADVQDFNGLNAKGLTRSDGNVHVAGIAESEAQFVNERIYGKTLDGVYVPGFQKRMGLTDAAADAMRDKLVSQIYASKATRLLSEGDLQGAEAVVRQHKAELGDHANEILGHIESKARLARADGIATQLKNDASFRLADGNINTKKAESWVEANVPEGPERLAAKSALFTEAERVQHGIAATSKASYQALLSDYQANGRSLDAIQRMDSWTYAKPEIRESMRQHYLADLREQAGRPLNTDQMRALSVIENDIASRTEFWGSTDESELLNNAEFRALPEGVQKSLVDRVAQLHHEKGNTSALLKASEQVILRRAQEDGHPLSSAKGKKFEEWIKDDDNLNLWRHVQDGVHSRIVAWKQDKANAKATFIPNAVVEGMVDDVTRTVRVKDGRWYVPGSTRKEGSIDATLKGDEIVAPVPYADEEAKGREVLRRQGYKPEEMTPEKIVEASRQIAAIPEAPSMPERAQIVKALRAAGAANPEDPNLILKMYQKSIPSKMRYIR